MRALISVLALAFGLAAWGGTPELEAATNSALAAERAFVDPAPPTTGPAWTDVETEVKASESRAHQYVDTEYQVLLDNLHALWGVTPPPIDPPIDPPPAVTGAIDIGNSGYPAKITPDFHGHTFDWSSAYWNEINRPVTGDAVDPQSARLIAKLNGLKVHIDFYAGNTPDHDAPYWGLPVNTVRGDAPRVSVDVPSGYPSESDAPIMIPMPAKPAIEGWLYTAGNLVGGAPNNTPPTFNDIENNPGTDHHMFIAVRDEATGGIGELIELSKPWFDGAWHAKQISRWGPDGLPRREGWTSTDAAGLPRYPLLPRYDEARSAGGIRHPLAMTFTEGNVMGRYISPARHSAEGADGLPFGARMRLTATWCAANKASFTSDARAIVDAMCTYGVINTDIGGNLFLMGVSDSRFDHANLMTLQNIPNTAFEVLKITPQFTLNCPATMQVNVEVTCSIAFNPLVETNGQHGYYVHVIERNPANTGWLCPLPNDPQHACYVLRDSSPHMVEYTTPIHDAPTFKFTVGKPGPILVEVDQAGEGKLEWTPPTQPIPGRGPYPYGQFTVTP